MDLATAAGLPEDVALGGEPHRVRLLTMRERGVIQGYLKKHLQNPVARAAIAIQEAKDAGHPLDVAVENRLWDRAEAAALSWPPRFGSQAWFNAIDGIEGGWERVLYEVLSKADLAFTMDDAEALAPAVSLDEWGDLIRVAFWGQPPAPKGGGAPNQTPTPSSPSGTTGPGSSPS